MRCFFYPHHFAYGSCMWINKQTPILFHLSSLLQQSEFQAFFLFISHFAFFHFACVWCMVPVRWSCSDFMQQHTQEHKKLFRMIYKCRMCNCATVQLATVPCSWINSEHTSNTMNKTKYHEMKIDKEDRNIKMC